MGMLGHETTPSRSGAARANQNRRCGACRSSVQLLPCGSRNAARETGDEYTAPHSKQRTAALVRYRKALAVPTWLHRPQCSDARKTFLVRHSIIRRTGVTLCERAFDGFAHLFKTYA